ncbi:MAG: excinuclease ABC subunit UvrA [Spirochaetales bacterium]|nr:excinuclease ABC subunit UvrA [Spirochaetales bacterium]
MKPRTKDRRQVVFTVKSLGYICKEKGKTLIKLDQSYAKGLKGLAQFSHVNILFWFDRLDHNRYRRMTRVKPPYELAPVAGVFATRSPVRPNLIGLSTVKIKSVDQENRTIEIHDTDALPQTPVIDIKPYYPYYDRVKQVKVADWLSHWPGWMTDDAEREAVQEDSLRPADCDRLARYMSTRSPARNKKIIPAAGAAIVMSAREQAEQNSGKDSIVVQGARQHNLKNITVSIPRNKFVVITGVSGSGKSSLAFDTVYAEGRRRYMDSFSVLARQLAHNIEKPQVDHISGLNPVIAIEQKSITRNPRSTVGTLTEIYDFLRLLFAKIGTRHCPQCGRAIKPLLAQQITERLSGLLPETEFRILAPLHTDDSADVTDSLARFMGKGFTEARINGTDIKLTDKTAFQALKKHKFNTAEIVINTFSAPKTGSDETGRYRAQIAQAVTTALDVGKGVLVIELAHDEEIRFSNRTTCPFCHTIFFKLTPALFSYNNPEGMCTECNGLGSILSVDPELIITEPALSLLDGASPWYGVLRNTKRTGNWMRGEIFALAEHWNVDLELPWRKLPEKFRQAVLYGSGEEKFTFNWKSERASRTGQIVRPVFGAVNHISRLFAKGKRDNSREFYLQFMRQKPCEVCRGERLCAEARFVTVGRTRYPDVATMTVEKAAAWIGTLKSSLQQEKSTIARELLDEIGLRLKALLKMGLHYLTLDRSADTLSGGEAQRIRLSGQLSNDLMGILYILDEPSMGLHPRDHKPLIKALKELSASGNSVLVVEHDADTMRAADWLLDLGPGAGSLGGQVVSAGTPKTIMQDPASLTGRYLKGLLKISAPQNNGKRQTKGWLTVSGAILHNLKNLDVRFPVGLVTCVTGVSGSGKSSLVAETLYPALSSYFSRAKDLPGLYKNLKGVEQMDKVINITQDPIGRTPRSNPCSYVELFESIRKLFVRTEKAEKRHYKLGHFSFNSKQGQCPVCQGMGRRRIEMHFMADVWVTCQSCNGRRFNNQTLEVTYNGKSIADILDMDVRQALEFFRDQPHLVRILRTMHDVGLDYLRLGQNALTLSGGEAQRIKLAKELGRSDTGNTLYILDEPTTGLHFDDIQKLVNLLHGLADAGNTVIIIEHNLDVIRTADWIIDLGPEGGERGGYLIAQGAPEEIMTAEQSYTGRYLKAIV